MASELIYAAVNQILTDEFTYLTSDGLNTPVTGKVQANFTITLSTNGTDGSSVAGITIAEIGGGKYLVSVPANGFVAATGLYTLVIVDTTTPQFRWEQIYKITSDGTPTGTFGPASFTATAANGRAFDGAAAIQGVTVLIRDPSNNLYTQVTTNASGLFGPVFFTTAGTYNCFYQKSGYSQGTATITVSGSTATGPGADVTMTVVTSGNTLVTSDVTAYARRMAGDRTGAKADTELLQAVNGAVDWIATAWPGRHQRYVTLGQIAINASYSTGTVAFTNGSANCTLTGGTWPSYAASCSIFVNGQTIKVSSRTSNAVIVLESSWQEATTSGLTFVLFQDTYTLPDNLFRFGKLIQGPRWSWGNFPVGPEMILENKATSQYGMKLAPMWAIMGSQLVLYPFPTDNTLMQFWYWRRPTPVVGPTDVVDMDSSLIETLRRSIDYQVSLRYNGYAGGTTEQAYARLDDQMKKAITADKTSTTTQSPDVFGRGAPHTTVNTWSYLP